MEDAVAAILVGVVAGTWARLYLLRIDYRMYPSYPQGYVIHLMLGAIAAFLGAVAIPAILAKNYQAATFLALAATQFREVRSLERETLKNMEETELVPRGTAYIEGIARVFEARNYLALFTGLAASAATQLLPFETTWRIGAGAVVGAVLPFLLYRFAQGQGVGDIADIDIMPIEFDGPILMVHGVRIVNVGLETAREVFKKQGLGVLIKPHDPNAKATLANIGQRQAIAHDSAGQLGIYKDVDDPVFTPLVRIDLDTGDLVLAIVPLERNPNALKVAVSHVPILEGARRRPLASRAGQIAD